ncbi:MAG: hypothetical protein HY975_01440 [Candidatus Kerfeldbacteria bacterium]|nr:hypothetical protein [Candidatus Kerfeldbacteria bacterium]
MPNAAAPRVLIACRCPIRTRQLQVALEPHGYVPQHVNSIADFDDQYRTEQFDALITDIPGIDEDFDGLTLACLCQGLMPALVLTENPNAHISDLLRLGFKGHIAFRAQPAEAALAVSELLKNVGRNRAIELARKRQAALA